MYKIVIADDEDLIRESIRKSIAWKSLNCRVVLEASDGSEILEFAEHSEIDIILLDINMPGMDGLTLAEKMKEAGHKAKVIIISAYQDFIHVKKAFQLDIIDYLPKPIRNDDLIQMIQKAKYRIEEERVERAQVQVLEDESRSLNEYYTQTRQLVQSELLAGYLAGEPDSGNLASLTELFPGDECPYSTILIKQICKPEYRIVNKHYILDYLDDEPFFSDFDIRTTVLQGNIVAIVFFTPQSLPADNRKALEQICDRLLSFIREWEYVHAYIGVSSFYREIKDLPLSYQGALHVAENQFFSHSDQINFNDGKSNLRDYKFSIIHDLDHFYQTLSSRISDSDEEEIEAMISHFIDEIASYSKHNIDLTKSLISEVCITTARLYLNTHKTVMSDFTVSDVIRDINALRSLEEAKDYVCSLIANMRPDDESSYSPAVQSSLSYIKTNFKNSISLDILSDHLGLNPSYLSRLLKKETAKNFSEIILFERLNASKNLLKDTSLRLYEIADQVGYKDYAYFYQVFKKNVGMTPMDYRKKSKSI